MNVCNSVFKYSKFKTPIIFWMILESIHRSKHCLIWIYFKGYFYANLNIQAFISLTHFWVIALWMQQMKCACLLHHLLVFLHHKPSLCFFSSSGFCKLKSEKLKTEKRCVKKGKWLISVVLRVKVSNKPKSYASFP